MEDEKEGFSPLFYAMLILGIIGVIGFVVTTGGVVLTGGG